MAIIRQHCEVGHGAQIPGHRSGPVLPLTLFKPKKGPVALCASMSFVQEAVLDWLCV